MKLTEQLADAPVSVHMPPGVKVTFPVGIDTVPTDVSKTVAVHVMAWLTTTVNNMHAMAVALARLFTVTNAVPPLVV
jgi:hypothetical protein